MKFEKEQRARAHEFVRETLGDRGMVAEYIRALEEVVRAVIALNAVAVARSTQETDCSQAQARLRTALNTIDWMEET